MKPTRIKRKAKKPTRRLRGWTKSSQESIEAEFLTFKKAQKQADEVEQQDNGEPIFGLPRRLVAGMLLAVIPDAAANRVGDELLFRHLLERLPDVVNAVCQLKPGLVGSPAASRPPLVVSRGKPQAGPASTRPGINEAAEQLPCPGSECRHYGRIGPCPCIRDGDDDEKDRFRPLPRRR